MLTRARNLARFLIVFAYVFLARHNACPCQLAGQVDRALFCVFRAISRCAAAVGGFICRHLDPLITAADNVCGPECQGCNRGAA